MSDAFSEFAAIEIETARLVLRLPEPGDAGRIAELAGDHAVASMTARIPHPYHLADAESYIRSSAENRRKGRALVLAVTRRGDGALIGCTGLNIGEKVSAEISYWTGRPHWGHGFATEAARALIDHAFETTRIEAVTGACRVMNDASRRVLEKCGLHYVTSGLAPAPARGGAMPVDRFRLSRRDWESFKAWRPATVRTRLGTPEPEAA